MTDVSAWPIVIVESPFAGDLAANEAYLHQCCRDCLARKEVPFASHGFFTRFLDDGNADHRETGLTAGYAFWPGALKIVFYVDLGMSPGMKAAKTRAERNGCYIETRTLQKGT